jgi:hypothetical protein
MIPSRATLLAALLLATGASAQAPNEFDFDTTQLPVTTVAAGSGTVFISSPVTYTAQNLQLNANLVVQNGGELVLQRSHLRVRGDVTIQRGGRITVVDSELLLPCDFTGQFTLWNEGGLLHTERAVLGGAYSNVIHAARFMHLRGTWLARHTTLQLMGVVIANGANGWYGNPAHRGGSIFADGLFEGDYADAIHMCGVGDAELTNGTMNVGFYYDASAAGQPSAATIDLQNTVPLDAVYGDPAVHEGVTHPVVGALCRLKLSRHRSAGWQFFVTNATQNGPLCTLTLRNTRDAIFGVTCENVTGSPVLGGPWSSYYSELPGLPSTQRPGFHAIPPTCSVQIGNVVFRSDVNEWSRIMSWGLYLNGAGTNYTVAGPSTIAELMVWQGHVHLNGTRSYDLGLLSGVTVLRAGATLTADNISIGTHDPSLGFVGLIESNDNSSCAITQARIAPLRLRTTSPAASISAQNVIGTANIVTDVGSGGVVQVAQATSAQDWDLQNLSMDVAGPAVPYWTVTGFSTNLVNDGAPGAPGNSSRELVAGAAGGSMRKTLTLPPDTYVMVVASTKLVQSSGPAPALRISQGGNVMTASLGTATAAWRRTTGSLVTVSGAGPTVVELVCNGPATVRIDDVRLLVNSWWDNDNLANLDFEGQYRYRGVAPTYLPAPDAWRSSVAACEPDTGTTRPGAAAGSRSVRVGLDGYGVVYKDLTFLRPGDQVVVSGWMRSVAPGGGVAAQIGEGSNWSIPTGNNQQVIHYSDGSWRQFTFTYTVPTNVTTTRLGLSGWGPAGTQCWFDDLTVSIQ